MKYDEWEVELRKELGEPVEPQPYTPPKKPSQEKNWVGPIIFFMTIAIAFAFFWKVDPTWLGLRRYIQPQAQTDPQTNPNPPPGTNPLPPDVSGDLKGLRETLGQLKSGQDKLGAQMTDLEKRVRIQGDRIILMGTIINDNAVGYKNGDRDPLYLNHDWTIPREPRYLQSAPEDAEWLKKRVSPPK